VPGLGVYTRRSYTVGIVRFSIELTIVADIVTGQCPMLVMCITGPWHVCYEADR
jgi:hypothetical protein